MMANIKVSVRRFVGDLPWSGATPPAAILMCDTSIIGPRLSLWSGPDLRTKVLEYIVQNQIIELCYNECKKEIETILLVMQ